MAECVDARAVDVGHGACRAKLQIAADEAMPMGSPGRRVLAARGAGDPAGA
jgi:hypothetical protein